MQLMPHQIDVLERTNQYNRCAYYLDMGLGKTFIGAEKMVRLGSKVNLIVCQKSKIEDWIDHIKQYYAEYQVLNLTSLGGMKAFLSWSHANMEIVGIINYELLWRRPQLIATLNEQPFTLMLDESSLITNENAKRSKFILKLKPDNVILLSGTPTAGKYEKLWSQCHLLGWEISKKAFWGSYVCTKWVDYGAGFMQEVVTGYKNVDHLKKKLAEHGTVFMKTEEVLTLPEQVEQNIYLNPTKEYKRFQKDHYLSLKDGTELIGSNSLTQMLYERQLCGQYHKGKLEAFEDLILSTEDRLVVFYNFNAELELLQEIAENHSRPFGTVNGFSRCTESFDDCDNGILFVQYQAGAMGGNYQKANKIVYFSLPLGKGSCDLWEQSKKRIHRIGQDRTCFYYYLLVKDSIEIKNLQSLKLGKDLTDELFRE